MEDQEEEQVEEEKEYVEEEKEDKRDGLARCDSALPRCSAGTLRFKCAEMCNYSAGRNRYVTHMCALMDPPHGGLVILGEVCTNKLHDHFNAVFFTFLFDI